MKKLLIYLGAAALALWAMFSVCLVTLWHFDLLKPPPETYVIDAKEVIRRFVEERGKDLDETEMVLAIQLIDQIVLHEAEKIHRSTGSIIINKNHMLAGGADVSHAFADLVIAAWDAAQ